MEFKVPCQRCNGEGSLSHFTHVDGGICFKCNGSKFQEVTELEYKVWELNEKEKLKSERYNRKKLMNDAVNYYLSNNEMVEVREYGKTKTFKSKLLTHEGFKYVSVDEVNRKVSVVFGKVNKRNRIDYFVKCFEMKPYESDFDLSIKSKKIDTEIKMIKKFISNFENQLKLNVEDRTFKLSDDELNENIENLKKSMEELNADF